MAIGAGGILTGLAVWFTAHRDGNASRLTQEGWQLWQARQLEAAAAKFEQAVQLEPEHPDAWNGLGWAAWNSGQWQKAEEAFQKAVTIQPNHLAAMNGLGQTYLMQRKFDQAEAALLKAAAKAPAAWYGLARLYLIQEKFEPAEEWARKAAEGGEGGELAHQILEAARTKRVSDDLRAKIEPPRATGESGKTDITE